MSQKFASMDELFEALSHSAFRSKFRLSYADRTYAETRNDELLKKHAKEILHDRIGSANPKTTANRRRTRDIRSLLRSTRPDAAAAAVFISGMGSTKAEN